MDSSFVCGKGSEKCILCISSSKVQVPDPKSPEKDHGLSAHRACAHDGKDVGGPNVHCHLSRPSCGTCPDCWHLAS